MTGIRIVVPVPVDVVFHARIKLFACFKFREVSLTCLIARPRCIALDHPVSHRIQGRTGATLGATAHHTSSDSRHSSTRKLGSHWNLLASTRHCKAPAH